MGTSGNMQGGFKFMSLRSMKNITKISWYMIPMPYTVIDRVNLLGKYQPELLLFTDCKGQIIGDGDVNITGTDGYTNKVSLLKIDNENENLGDQ